MSEKQIDPGWREKIQVQREQGVDLCELFSRLVKEGFSVAEIVAELKYIPGDIKDIIHERYDLKTLDYRKVRWQAKRIEERIDADADFERINNEIEIWQCDRFISGKMCEEIYELALGTVERSTVVAEEKYSDVRTSQSATLWPQSGCAAKYINECFLDRFNLGVGEMETPQFHLYKPGGDEYRPHFDFFLKSNVDLYEEATALMGQRTWTAILYLKDVAVGGETHFPKLDLRIKPVQGRLIIWNNLTRTAKTNELTLHAGLPTHSEEKSIVSLWMREGN